MKYFLLLVTFLTLPQVFGQVSDNFSDGNFSLTPTWSGDDSVYTILDVAGDFQLRSNKLLPNSSFYLATASTLSTDAQWEFFVNLNLNTSSANYTDIYLTADQSNLLSPSLSGYFVRIGGTTDEISLYRKVSGAATKIIDGADGITNTSINTLKIKVICTASNDWTLSRDITGTGISFFTEGTINDASVTGSSFFGISITQSTASFFQKHFFDDLYVGPIIYDVTPPVLISATAINAIQIDVLFNEPLNQASAETLLNYTLQVAPPALAAVNLDLTNPALVHLTTSTAMTNGTSYTLNSNNIADVSSNVSGTQSVPFQYLVAENPVVGDVIINEFLCDETPSVGLPLVEYVEIVNLSSKYFNLNGWKLGDASSDGTVQTAWLMPGEHKVLCATANVDSFSVAVPVSSFPSLNNSGDDIVLKDNTGLILDKISYNLTWYNNPAKEDGGYSIERINPNDPCSAADNWKASNAFIGGTPSAINSVYDITPDTENPQIIELIALAPNFLEIYFSEGMDSTSLKNMVTDINPNLIISNNYVLSAFPNMCTLEFATALVPSLNYTIQLTGASDCWGNTTVLLDQFTLPDLAEAGDVIINEILFDPYTGGSDWIELYNTSSKVINLKNWQFASYDDDTISNQKAIPNNFLLFPNQFVVVGKDSTFVKQNYPFAVTGNFIDADLPSYNNDSSTVYLINNALVMDKVSYTDDWHFKLLDVTDGVSLERITFEGPSSNLNNWHSAAEAVSWATPGGQNSQYFPAGSSGEFSYTSATFSPDSDGFEDVLQINYEMEEPGLLGTFTIYDDRGRLIMELFKNELLGTSGTFKWDGVKENGTKTTIGTYVGVFEAFKVDGGQKYAKRKVFVVSGKL